MIYSGIEWLLTPLIWLMGVVFRGLNTVGSSPGLSVILLAAIVSIVTVPLRKWATKVEGRIAARKKAADEQVAREASGLKGEARFKVIERAYAENHYNPIQGVMLGLPFFVLIPFLLSALFLFHDNPELTGVSFLFIPDLGAADRLLGGVNVLPFVMSAVTVVDALYRYSADRSALLRFIGIAIVLLVLVYNLASALVLYWTASNVISFLIYGLRSLRYNN